MRIYIVNDKMGESSYPKAAQSRRLGIIMGIVLFCSFVIITVLIVTLVDNDKDSAKKPASVKTTTTTTTPPPPTTLMPLDGIVIGTAPIITIVSPILQEEVFSDDSGINLECSATGLPLPTLLWYKDNEPLTDTPNNVQVLPSDTTLKILIDPLSALDAGAYHCQASNSFGTTVSEQQVLTQAVLGSYPPSFPDENYTVIDGDGLRVERLPTKCVPSPALSWSVMNSKTDETSNPVVMDERVHVSKKGHLYFSYVLPDDEQNGDYYSCAVYNSKLDLTTSGSFSIITVVASNDSDSNIPPTLATSENVTAADGDESVELECIFYGKPAPTILWTMADGTEIPLDRYQLTNANTRLRFDSLAVSDAGVYTCEATNDAGTVQHNVTLTVGRAPSFLHSSDTPQQIIAEVGDQVFFRCQATADPPATVEWLINGQPLADSIYDKVNETQSGLWLTIPDSLNSSGIQCNARNSFGSVFASGSLIVAPTKRAFIRKALNNSIPVDVVPFTNWDGTATRTRLFAVTPTTLKEIQDVVAMMQTINIRGRSVGTAYSYADVYPDEDTLLINMSKVVTRFDGDPIQLDRNAMTVTAAAGLLVENLIDFMIDNQVQIVTGSVFNPTLGGSFSVGTSNGFLSTSSMSDELVGMRLVAANGSLLQYTLESHPKEFAALKLCIGMCGVIYDVTFKVVPLEVVKVSNLFPSVADFLRNTSWLVDQLDAGGVVSHWAPFSSFTNQDWDTYSNEGTIPANYDPWNDVLWMKTYETTPNGTMPADPDSLRSRRSLGEEIPGLLGGRVRRQALARPLDVHRTLYTEVLDGYGNVTPFNQYLPLALSYIDGTNITKTYGLGFAIEDTADFNTTRQAVNIIFARAKILANEGQMPVLTTIFRWSKISSDCLICAERKTRSDTTHIFRVELTGASWKSGFDEFANQIFQDLQANQVPFLVHWAKYYSFVEGLPEYLTQTLGDNLVEFKRIVAEAKWDPKYLLPNKYLRKIFVD